MAQNDRVEIDKGDLQAAWAVLENLAVSFDQMGGKFGGEENSLNGAERARAVAEALAAYLTPELVKAINDVRARLGRYIPDDDAETLAEQIAYWDYGHADKATSRAR